MQKQHSKHNTIAHNAIKGYPMKQATLNLSGKTEYCNMIPYIKTYVKGKQKARRKPTQGMAA